MEINPNHQTTRGSEIEERILYFLTSMQIGIGWGDFLLEVLSDPAQVERLRSLLAARLEGATRRTPVEILLQDHLQAAPYTYRVGVTDVYGFYRELCRADGSEPVAMTTLTRLILDRFPDAVRRFAPRPVGAHFSFLSLVTGKGADHV